MKYRYLTSVSAAALLLAVTGTAHAQSTVSANVNTGGDTNVFNNAVVDNSNERENEILDSVAEDAAGIVIAQQNNGSANTVQAAVAVNANLDDLVGPITANASVVGSTNNNSVTHTPGNTNPPQRSNLIGDGSFDDHSGVTVVQQNNGDANEIGAATAVSGADSATGISQSASTAGSTYLNSTPGSFQDWNGPDVPSLLDPGSTRDNRIEDGSFDDSDGVHTVQQNNGNANAIGAAVSVAGSASALAGNVQQTATVAGTLGVLGAAAATDDGSDRDNTVDGSFDDADGVVSVQQNNGDQNILGSAVAVTGASEDEPQSVGGSVTQTALANGVQLRDLAAGDNSSERTNTINPSFNDSDGVITVQQNNGNVNVMASATAVTGVTGGTGNITQNAQANSDLRFVDTARVGVDRDNLIENSFEDSQGRVVVQQNNGDANGMAIATAIVAADGDTGNIGQTAFATGKVEDYQHSDTGNSELDNEIFGSMEDAGGTFAVQQNNGDGNSINSSFAVAATETADDNGSTLFSQNVQANGTVSNLTNWTENVADVGSLRANEIDDSFDDFSGQASVQQNNGDANVMSAANGIIAVTGNGGNAGDVSQNVSTSGTVLDVESSTDSLLSGDRSNDIDGSFEDSAGFVTVQQNNGSSNAILAAGGLSTDRGDGSDGNLEDVTTQAVSTTGTVNQISASQQSAPGSGLERANTIDNDSFDDAEGIYTVQQNNGDANVIGAATAIHASVDGDDIDTAQSMTATTTGSVNDTEAVQNLVFDAEGNRGNEIDDAFNDGASGIFTVHQNNGNANVIGSATGVVANQSNVATADGPIANTASGTGSVTNVLTQVGGQPDRTNTVDESFNDGFAGIGSFVQNNGDANVIGQATSVAASDVGSGSGWGSSVSTATLSGTVSGTTMTVGGLFAATQQVQMSNSLTGSFNGANGVVSLAQNNGNGNVIQSAVTVTANY